MANIELSIEETNKLRAQIGLPLIPLPQPIKNETTERQSLSVAETNKLRLSLGLPPIEQPENQSAEPQTLPSKEQADSPVPEPESFPIKKVGKLFYDDVDTDSWLDNLAVERDVTSHAVERNGSDESDNEVVVDHDSRALSLLKEGEMLTLKDGGILDEGDHLENETLLKETRTRKDKKEREKIDMLQFGRKPHYDEARSDDDSADGKVVMAGSQIVLKGTESTETTESAEKLGELKLNDLFDDELENRPKVTMKKFKTKKPKSSKKRRREDEDLEELKVDGPMVTVALEAGIEAEDDLDRILSLSRNKKIKARKQMSAEEISNEIRQHNRLDRVNEIDGAFVYDDTKDFLDSLTPDVTPDAATHPQPETTQPDSTQPETTQPQVEEAANVKEKSTGEAGNENDETDVTPKFASLLSTLKYFREQSTSSTEQRRLERERQERQKEAELERIQITIEERIVRQELDADKSYTRLPKEEQEKIFERMLNDRLVSKGIAFEPVSKGRYSRYAAPKDRLAEYNPQVKIQYKDAKGNELDTKQAWKELLHKYHGLAPKNRKEKPKTKSTGERVIG